MRFRHIQWVNQILEGTVVETRVSSKGLHKGSYLNGKGYRDLKKIRNLYKRWNRSFGKPTITSIKKDHLSFLCPFFIIVVIILYDLVYTSTYFTYGFDEFTLSPSRLLPPN